MKSRMCEPKRGEHEAFPLSSAYIDGRAAGYWVSYAAELLSICIDS